MMQRVDVGFAERHYSTRSGFRRVASARALERLGLAHKGGVAGRMLARLTGLADFPARLRALALGRPYNDWVRGTVMN